MPVDGSRQALLAKQNAEVNIRRDKKLSLLAWRSAEAHIGQKQARCIIRITKDYQKSRTMIFQGHIVLAKRLN